MAFGPHPSFWGKYIVNSFVKMQRLFWIKKLPASPPLSEILQKFVGLPYANWQVGFIGEHGN